MRNSIFRRNELSSDWYHHFFQYSNLKKRLRPLSNEIKELILLIKISSSRTRKDRSNRIESNRKEKKKREESRAKIWANWAVNAYQIAHYNWKVDAYARRARAATVRPARILFLRNHNSNCRYRIELHGDCYGRRSMNERMIRKGGSPPVPRIPVIRACVQDMLRVRLLFPLRQYFEWEEYNDPTTG